MCSWLGNRGLEYIYRRTSFASRTTGTILESRRKSEPFHVQNDDGQLVGRRMEFLRSTGMRA